MGFISTCEVCLNLKPGLRVKDLDSCFNCARPLGISRCKRLRYTSWVQVCHHGISTVTKKLQKPVNPTLFDVGMKS